MPGVHYSYAGRYLNCCSLSGRIYLQYLHLYGVSYTVCPVNGLLFPYITDTINTYINKASTP